MPHDDGDGGGSGVDGLWLRDGSAVESCKPILHKHWRESGFLYVTLVKVAFGHGM